MRRSTPETAAGVFESTPRELPASVLSMGLGGCEIVPCAWRWIHVVCFWRAVEFCPVYGDNAPGAEFVGGPDPCATLRG